MSYGLKASSCHPLIVNQHVAIHNVQLIFVSVQRTAQIISLRIFLQTGIMVDGDSTLMAVAAILRS